MKSITTKDRGDAAEDAALDHLRQAGLVLVERNYRTPGRGGGEIDLIMRDPRDATLVFVEVRQRSAGTHGGAGGSITGVKRRRIVFAARHYLTACARCRLAASTWCWWSRASPGCRAPSMPIDSRRAGTECASDAPHCKRLVSLPPGIIPPHARATDSATFHRQRRPQVPGRSGSQ